MRAVAHGESRFSSFCVIESQMNRGLANSIIEGVSATIADYGRVIVLEDDIVVGPNFLSFMNTGLNLYSKNESVASICAYMYPINSSELPPVFFIKGTDCWGWATWKRSWDIFEADGAKLLTEINMRKLRWKFDYDGTYPYCKMLEDQILGKNSSWAIRWHAAAYLKGMVSCFPSISLVQNIGLDGSGVHCQATSDYDEPIRKSIPELIFPSDIEENLLAREEVLKFHYCRQPMLRRIYSDIQSLFKNRR